MSRAARKVEQRDIVGDEAPVTEASQGLVASPPALLHLSPRPQEKVEMQPGSTELPEAGEQLALPLEMEPERVPMRATPPKRRRKGSRGFVPVTRDPEVAQSYSDNVALDYAIARGLAQVLSTLPPEELAALRARVARAAREKRKETRD